MNEHNRQHEDEDVVVIEQRDKRSYLYIGLAAFLGLLVGGLFGSIATASKWEQNYKELEARYQQANSANDQLSHQAQEAVAGVDSQIKQQVQVQVQAAVKEQQDKHQQEMDKVLQEMQSLKETNQALQSQVKQQKNQMEQVEQKNTKLNRQADLQVTMLERSRELFQREAKVKEELAKLEKERTELVPKLSKLKKECQLYLEGTSWDAKSDACDRQDSANSRLSQINQMINVHKMDLEEIKNLSEQLGL